MKINTGTIGQKKFITGASDLPVIPFASITQNQTLASGNYFLLLMTTVTEQFPQRFLGAFSLPGIFFTTVTKSSQLLLPFYFQ